MSSAGVTGETEFPGASALQLKNQFGVMVGMNGQWRKMYSMLRENKTMYLK